ncbi:hypothetical protein [Clostridium sp.]|nr:hypothetical protein [Clostridium sp.]MDR3597729.1 hypothetical protein [Clostridium sp.]
MGKKKKSKKNKNNRVEIWTEEQAEEYLKCRNCCKEYTVTFEENLWV